MNSRLVWLLVKGELERLHKYNLTTISVGVAILWSIILYFVGGDLLKMLLPMVILMDATVMAIMYVGSIMYFEKSESTISTLLVTPVSNVDLLVSKIIANTLHNVFSSALIIIAFSFLSDVVINYFLITIAIDRTTEVHTVIGICMSYTTKDFTRMLLRSMSFAFLLMIPTLLVFFGVLKGEAWEYINLINPVNSALVLLSASFENAEITWHFWVSLVYFIVGGSLLYYYYALPKFKEYAVKQSGV